MKVKQYLVNGWVSPITEGWHLQIPPTREAVYADAQLDDYVHPPNASFEHSPPVKLALEARFSHQRMTGTSGFGFWNHPFGDRGDIREPPCSVWYFNASSESDMRTRRDTVGWGFKAATLDSGQWLAHFPQGVLRAANLIGKVLLRMRPVARIFMAGTQTMVRASETLLTDGLHSEGPVSITNWHRYEIDWQRTHADFFVDGQLVLHAPSPPLGPLGFVAWVDNYRAVAANGRYEFGYLASDHDQWLEIRGLKIE